MTTKKKLAVLGGGASSLFAVWDLVHSDPNAYDITVYQMGWRLGGKGASGRNKDARQRIEEHGLHLMFGFYQNVFRVVREAYGESYPEHPNVWRDFFKTADAQVVMINFLNAQKTKWEPWIVPYPSESSDEPGDPAADEDEFHVVKRILENLFHWIGGALSSPFGNNDLLFDAGIEPSLTLDELRALIDELDKQGIDSLKGLEPLDPVNPSNVRGRLSAWWDLARAFVRKLEPEVPNVSKLDDDLRRFDALIGRMRDVFDWARSHVGNQTHAMLVFMSAVGRGMFVDLFLQRKSNWFSLDEYNFGDWIQRHGGDPKSPVVIGLYDAVFGSYSALGAGAILQSSMKAAFLFRGGAIYKMYAGMGDTIFTPLYLALKKLGVKFEFFHRVEQLGLSPDRSAVETIVVEKQVKLKTGTYDPLIDVDVAIGPITKLGCWPSEPLFDQIADADRARVENTIDLESYWVAPAPDRQITLKRGQDFDAVILGISVAALPTLCPALLSEDPAFSDHVQRLARATTATQAFQLWWNRDQKPQSPKPIVVPFDEPFDTIADMSHLRAAEPGSDDIGGIHYLCSAIYEGSPPPPRSQEKYPKALRECARNNALEWMRKRAPVLWPEFAWPALYDPANGDGEARFGAQFVSTPTNLSDRYVLPVPMSFNYRLLSNGTKFTNLYITGDWIRTSLSVGCLEAAAMSGLQAARAVSLELNPAHPVKRAYGDWIDDVQPRASTAAAALAARAGARYRKRDGEVIAPPPFEISCPSLLMFVLNADAAKLQALCDEQLNIGATRYSPLGSYAVLYAANLETASTGVTCGAKEVGIWVPVTKTVNGKRQLRTYSAYVWLDSATSTLSGRAIYGYTKYTASVDAPMRDTLRDGVTVTGDAIVAGTGTNPWCMSRKQLLSASPNNPSAAVPGSLAGYIELAHALGDIVEQTPSDLLALFSGMRSVFLKQIPAGAGPSASYQAIVEASIVPHIDTVHGAPLGPWTITIPARYEPSIVDVLGLEADEQYDPTMNRISIVKPRAQMWMSFQGRIDPAEEV